MNKQDLEIKLLAAFESGFDPYNKPDNAGPIQITDKEDEETRITVVYRTMDEVGRLHNNQFIYDLTEAEQLLKEYTK